MNQVEPSGNVPDFYDRQIGALDGLPDVVKSRASIVRTIPPLGIGGTATFTLQTFRQAKRGDTLFLECVSQAGVVRLVIPPAVCRIIASQRDALTARVRSKVAKQRAADQKAAGVVPGFLRRKEQSA